jgi:ABC-type branched-subunit amino acid transport system ATPase component
VVFNRSAARPVLTGPALAVTDVSVTFGGLRAVDKASVFAQPGEVVGLIGTNGAGKSTLMNAIGGFAPSEGTIEILCRDASQMNSANRARLGLGRTFQAARLFPDLTVRETVQVALEARGRTGLLSTALHLPSATRAERSKRSDADDLIGFLGLGRYSDAFVADLSTGTRRIVELAGLLALDAQVLCLDEPTAGIAQRETEAFGPLLKQIQQELDATLIVIEHDMPMIMALSDRVYCLEAGQVIAQGTPDEVRNDPQVLASYLGTDQRAIDRSDS